MTPFRSITATDMARHLSDLLNQVRYQGITLEIKRGAEVIALVTPAQPVQGFPIRQLDDLLSGLPGLDEDERDHFLNDLQASQAQLTGEDDPWDS